MTEKGIVKVRLRGTPDDIEKTKTLLPPDLKWSPMRHDQQAETVRVYSILKIKKNDSFPEFVNKH